MNILKKSSKSLLTTKGSKFIGLCFPTENKAGFERTLEEIKSSYHDATHHCYAWRLNPSKIKEFMQDDGEPSGTAGLPILNQLKSFNVINTGLVVIRYYGGTKLGKSGLIQAYGATAEGCLQQASLKPIQLIWKVKIQYPYAEQNTIDKLSHQYGLKEMEASYTENISLVMACPVAHQKALKTELAHLKHRNIKSVFLEQSYR